MQQEALWRLDEVLESAMAGVRLGDGTTWVKSRGYTWVLGSYMAAKLYPQGETSIARFLSLALDKGHWHVWLDTPSLSAPFYRLKCGVLCCCCCCC